MDGTIAENQIRIERPLYEQVEIRHQYEYQKPHEKSFKEALCAPMKNIQWRKKLVQTIPVIGWMSEYKWKEDLLGDFISGCTVAIMHIPQGMGYAMLGNVDPVVGIYMAFFPVLVYFFLGTSRHISMGTFAVVCLMTGKAVLEYSDPIYFKEGNFDSSIVSAEVNGYTPIQVATAVTFIVGLIQIAMYFLRLGFISTLLSETLVSGFTTGAAVQVLTSQAQGLFGLTLEKEKGYFVVIYTLKNIFQEIHNTNWAAVLISAITIAVVVFNNEYLKAKVAKVSRFPVPIELLVIVIGTLVSYFMNLEEKYNVPILKKIPTGLPPFQVPPMELLGKVAVDGFTIAIVGYTICLSMALIFANKLNYEIDANQEFLAQGAGNVFGSFFSCMPFAISMSRSTIQQTVGGKTQIASIVSCSILVVVLLVVGHLFEPLPKCVLASIIVVALKGMMWQVKDFKKFLKLSKMDALVWMGTFLTVVIVSMDIGLLVGIILSLATIFLFSFKPYTCLLGSIPGTDLYLDIKKYKSAVELAGLKIFHYASGLNFSTRDVFKSELFKRLDINPQKQLKYRMKLKKLTDKERNGTENGKGKSHNDSDEKRLDKIKKLNKKIKADIKCLILDFSALNYIDPSGVAMLKSLIESFNKIDISTFICGTPEPAFEMMMKCNMFDGKKIEIKSFATVHDAVEFVNENCDLPKVSLISRL